MKEIIRSARVFSADTVFVHKLSVINQRFSFMCSQALGLPWIPYNYREVSFWEAKYEVSF